MIHFFLTAGELTWQYRRALKTAQVHGEEVALWYTGEWPRDVDDCYVRRLGVPPWLENAHPSTKYDYLALKTLYNYGGMTLGLDSISIRPALDLLPEGKELCVGSDVPFINGRYISELGHEVADPFNNHLIAKRQSGVVGEMLEEAERRVRSGDSRWGATGPLLLTVFVLNNPDCVAVASFPALCGWEGSYIWRFYQGLEEPAPNVRVIHLFSSAYPKEYAHFHWSDGARGHACELGEASGALGLPGTASKMAEEHPTIV